VPFIFSAKKQYLDDQNSQNDRRKQEYLFPVFKNEAFFEKINNRIKNEEDY
jgi:hypothetical protein